MTPTTSLAPSSTRSFAASSWGAAPSVRRPHQALVARLSHQSVAKHYDAYADIDWDGDAMRIEVDDPRWEKGADDPLGATDWYRSLPQPTRARLGLHWISAQMKLGADFEGVLCRGLLELITQLPSCAPELRYAYHEVIEECQHSLIFNEFVRRTGLQVRGLSGLEAIGSRQVVRFGRTFPELFLLFVIAGETPIDYVQRQELRKREALHPLLRRVMQIHVTEEARHLGFAKSAVREWVPRLGAWRLLQLRVRTPILLSVMTRQMVEPPGWLVREYGIPKSVLREAYRDNPAHQREIHAGLAPVRQLCADTGIVTPRWATLWRSLGVWPSGDAGTPRLQRAEVQS